MSNGIAAPFTGGEYYTWFPVNQKDATIRGRWRGEKREKRGVHRETERGKENSIEIPLHCTSRP